ncbi:hypothetical protein OESDEN_01028 [Oesophagostomum dentatum]|uniref:DDE Tnp4 domain-containing protein n=1 Tax=Oesophagostomum dentatum TaxID=61180 RepID=A0A0B1TS70_OESDE|nr:hypothetical protein OESDEN_01028 [Oesophagostomum dentatum]
MDTLLGDSAYRSEFFLLKPILDAALDSREARYTDAVCRVRVLVENAIGVLKRQYEPGKVATMISVAICLRNAAIDMGEPDFSESDDEEDDSGDMEQDNEITPTGSALLSAVLQNYF